MGFRVVSIVVVALLFAVAYAAGAAEPPLEAADRAFLAAYQSAATGAVSELPMVLLLLGDEIVLYEKGERKQVYAYLPPLYGKLKSVAHVPLAVMCLVESADGKPLAAGLLEEARTLRDGASEALAGIASEGFSEEQLPRQRALLQPSITVLDRLLAGEVIPAEAELAFARGMAPRQMKNVAEAARAQLEALNRVMATILAETTPEDAAHVHVVIAGVHQARKLNLAVQYFEKLLRVSGADESKVIYAEGVFDEPGMMALLSRHVLDVQISEQFWGDKRRMQRDLMGPSGEKILETLPMPNLKAATH